MRLLQSPAKDEFGKCRSLGRKELVDIARRHPLARRDRGQSQIAVAEVDGNVGFYRLQPCHPYAAPLSDRCSIARRAEAQRNQIMNVGHNHMAQLRRGQQSAVPDSADIARQEAERSGRARYQPYCSGVEAWNQRCQCVARHAQPEEVRWCRTADGKVAGRMGQQDRLSVAHCDFATSLGGGAGARQVDAEKDIIAVAAGVPRCHLPQSGERTREDTGAGQDPLCYLRVQRTIR